MYTHTYISTHVTLKMHTQKNTHRQILCIHSAFTCTARVASNTPVYDFGMTWKYDKKREAKKLQQ